jgi:phage terminase Nu1 subunit (DNA packaging protein)
MMEIKPMQEKGTKSVLAEWLNCAPVMIDQYKARGIVKQDGHMYEIKENVQTVVQYFRDLAGRRSVADDDALKQARIDETETKTRRMEIEIAEKEGALLPVGQVQETFARTIREIAIWIDALPDSLERQGILDKRGIEKDRSECDQQRKNLHDRLDRILREEIQAQQPEVVTPVDDPKPRVVEAAQEGKRKPGRPKRIHSS